MEEKGNNNSETPAKSFSQKDKWSMFRNFMYNELGITKADIRIWIHEAVQEEAKKLVENSFNNFSVKREISKELLSKFDNYDFKRSLANEIVSKISIAVKE
jgi:hypothetical protein